MNSASDYVVKKIAEDEFELWFEERLLATMTKEEAYPVMLGQIHPEKFLAEQGGDSLLGQERESEG